MKIDEKIKKEIRTKLEDVFGKQYNKSDFFDLALLDLMCEVTHKTGYEVAFVLNRKGVLQDLFVGDKISVDLDAEVKAKSGLNGLRIIHSHPNGNSALSNLDKSALLNSLYDCVVAIGVKDGRATTAHAGFVGVGNDGELFVDEVFVHNPYYINKFGLFEKLQESEKEVKKQKSNLHNNSNAIYRAVLVMAEINKEDNLEEDLEELEGLAKTAGISVLDKIGQKRGKPDPRYVVGEGKLEEVRQAVQNNNANLVIFDNALQGSKQSNLVRELGVDVIDRSRLILDIFAKRAQTREGKLQVELAQQKYLLPRVASMSRADGGGSGIGLKGPGESKVELNRRIVENKILKLQRDLECVKQTRQVARQNRVRGNKVVISLVGYTNSGKSSLMNALSGADVYEKDELFATLDTTTRNVWLSKDKEVLLIDTVGFINKLPHEFVAAFSSTLEESVHADLLLHVVDASNSQYEKQIEVVESVLKQIGAKSKIITVYNKIDRLKDKQLQQIKQTAKPDSLFISAKKGTNLQDLKSVLKNLA